MGYKRIYITIRRKLSSIGIKNTFFLIVKRTYYTLFYSKDLFFAADLSNYHPDEKPINNEVEISEKTLFKRLTETEKKTLREYGGKDLLSLFEKRLERGHRLFLTYLNGEVAGASWIYEGGKGKFFIIPLSKKDFFILAVFTIDKFRKKGVGTASLIYLLEKMKREGFQRSFISTKEWNTYQKIIEKVGFECFGKYREFRIFKRHILIWYSVSRPDFL
jgi:GNAT superfamily N-acetyltransferase